MMINVPNGTMFLTIKAIDTKTNEEEIIEDLYWFEENGVHDFSGYAMHGRYKFEISLKIQKNSIKG